MKPVRILTAAAVLLALVLAIAWLSGWFEEKIEPTDRPVRAEKSVDDLDLVTVEAVTDLATEWASGTIESARRTTVAPRILARVMEVRVAAGDEVVSGDTLVVLDPRDLEARVKQAREAFKAAQARLELAQSEFNRAEELLKKGVATRQRFDQAATALRVAGTDVERLARAQEEAETALSYAEVKAAAPGRVIDRLVEPGDTVSPGQALLRLYDPSAMRVEAPVRETLAIGLEVGDRLDVEISAAGQLFTGTIEEIVPYSEPGARALLVKTRLPDDRRLFAGMFARIAVPAGETTRLVVPETAVRRVGQLEFVTVRAGGRPSRRLVTTGERVGEANIEILSGLKASEKVIRVSR